MNINLDDTIVALSTPPGEGAIGVIRLSGKDAIGITNDLFRGRNLLEVEVNTLHFGKIVAGVNEQVIDEVVVGVFKGPRSYTGEDIIEISCHGSPYILQKVLSLCLKGGARMANRGEFTMRAFLNGKMDLSQAEAVADLIASKSEERHHLAMKQMRKGFSNEISSLRQELIDFAAMIELELDFSEEDVAFADREKLKELVEQINQVINKLRDSFHLGNVIKNGVTTVIAGRPNAGKSTLLNALLNEDRAIVSDIAGTTRDTIEENLNINGIEFRLIDTAGIREAHDQIESIGVEKTFEKIQKSTIVVYVFDVTITDPEQLWQELDYTVTQTRTDGINLLCVANKMDLNPYIKPTSYYKEGLVDAQNIITCSALNQMNIEYIKSKLYDMVVADPEMLDQTIVSNTRHYEALSQARESLDAVVDGLMSGVTADFIAMDIKRALYHLGEITGEISNEDLLDSIFTRFCIGK
ncbi:MAG TPA: tRNA uridine-5-carboxymethylaminomethyl(34) synthesis GTPase MnmE [Saprospiraceae bacterium]|nr:tRNA uridine-5-carboxymethylaminomethyl(34) synthesis GTPase MnmE [Saprospiraceae bacterium]